MELLIIFSINILMYPGVVLSSWDKDEFLSVMETTTVVPEFEVKDLYIIECCGFSKAVEKFPLKSEANEKDKWEKIAIWKHKTKADKESRAYTLDCFKSLPKGDQYLARIFTDPQVVLLELEVTNCENVPTVVYIGDMTFDHGEKVWYHNIDINNLKHPWKNRSKLSDGVIIANDSSEEPFQGKRKEIKISYKCHHFTVYEKNNQDGACKPDTKFHPDDWNEEKVAA